MTTVHLDEVTKTYTSAVDSGGVFDLAFDIPDGEFTTLLGHSGSGKTTTLRLLAGFLRPDTGSIRFGDELVAGPGRFVATHHRDLAMVFQSYALWPHLTVFDNVAFGLKVRRRNRKEIADRVGEALGLVGMQGYEERRPGELSGGQQQRVALARSLVLRPGLLLLDEPLSNLDAELRGQMRDQLKDLQRRTGITFVYVTHDQEEALALSDTLVVLQDGRVLQHGPPEDLYLRPRDARVARFLCRGGAVLPGTVAAVEGKHVRLALTADGAGVGARGVPVDGLDVGVGEEATLVVQAEQLRIRPRADDPAAGCQHLEGEVVAINFVGREYQVDVRLDVGGRVTVSDQERSGIAAGDRVAVAYPVDRGVVVPVGG